MKCENCSNEMSQVYNMDHHYCDSCQSYSFPTSLGLSEDGIQSTNKETDFLCPVCPDSSMQVGKIDGVQVCFCNQCRGFVIDSLSLGSLIRSRRANFKGADDAPALMPQDQLRVTTNCPACFQPMQTHPYYGPGNVVLDSCPGCELTWLGHGELTKIIRAPGIRA